jgi:hypothetical protein
MKQELKNAFGKVYLTIEVDILKHWVHTNWVGYLSEENTKAGTEAYTRAVSESGFHCVLNDSSRVLGRWEHSLEWALHEWVPQAVYAGIKYFALVAKPGSFSAENAAALMAGVHGFEMQIFDSKTEAENWLLPLCLNLEL